MRLNLFRTPKHRRYDYVPMYYNPDKEEFQKRMNAAEQRAKKDSEGAKARISNGLRKGSYRGSGYAAHRRKAIMKSNLVLLLILALLILGTLYGLAVYLPQIEQALG